MSTVVGGSRLRVTLLAPFMVLALLVAWMLPSAGTLAGADEGGSSGVQVEVAPGLAGVEAVAYAPVDESLLEHINIYDEAGATFGFAAQPGTQIQFYLEFADDVTVPWGAPILIEEASHHVLIDREDPELATLQVGAPGFTEHVLFLEDEQGEMLLVSELYGLVERAVFHVPAGTYVLHYFNDDADLYYGGATFEDASRIVLAGADVTYVELELPETPADVPGTLPAPSVVPDFTSAVVSWEEPLNDGGSPVTGYDVSLFVGAETTPIRNEQVGPETSFTFTGLTEGMTYEVALAAINAAGSGEPSFLTSFTTKSTATVPVAMAKPTAAKAGDKQIKFSWAEPASNGGSPITGYLLRVTPNGGQATDITLNSRQRSFTYTAPAYGTYTAQILASNVIGDGAFSPASNAVTLTAPPVPSPSPTTAPPTSKPTTPPALDYPAKLYQVPGPHSYNGRQWHTTCEPYSQTTRCRTELWATTIELINGQYVQKNGWLFNNLTYLASPREGWKGNDLGGNGTVGHRGDWNSGGREWRTECDSAATGRGGCRTHILATVIEPKPGGGFVSVNKWLFNNIVLFSS